jgi:hypothetical protein
LYFSSQRSVLAPPKGIEDPKRGQRSKKNIKNTYGYMDFAIRRGLIIELHAMFDKCMYPTKEVTESLGAFFALKRYSYVDKMRYGSDVVVYCLGDGKKPRTASTLAYLSDWKVHSIDPDLNFNIKLNLKKKIDPMTRVSLHKCKSEDFNHIRNNVDLSIVVAVHSHAPFEEFWNRVPGNKIAVAIPCCIDHSISTLKPLESYDDPYILSDKRRVFIWSNFDFSS